ncbi:nuclear transport factor 2 family protein [Pseudarthrobacter siccitolerans]
MTTLQPQIQELLDKQALHDNLMQYCRGIDRMDLDLMKSTYWPDGTDSHGRYEGSAHGWCEEAMKSREVLVSCNHHIGNVYCEIDGNRAKRESMFMVVTTYKDNSPTMFLGGRYRDLCEKRDGEWKILRRVCVWDWNQKFEFDPGWTIMRAPDSSYWGQFHPQDPVYQDWYESPKTLASNSNRPEVQRL